MSARYENENKIDRSIENKLKTLPKYVYDWNLNMKASRKSAATRRDFVYKVYHFLKFINDNPKEVKVEDITEEKVTRYYISLQNKTYNGKEVPTSDSYQITVWSCLNNFFNFLNKHGYIEKNYMLSTEKPKNKDMDHINENRIKLTSNDFKSIIDAVDSQDETVMKIRDKAILLTFMTTGMRETALMNIEMSDVDMENRTLKVIDKGTKAHEYVMNDILYEALNEWIKYRWVYNNDIFEDQHLFLSKNRKPLSTVGIAAIVQKYTKIGIGKKLSPHKLRAGFATILYDKTHNIEFVRRAIGHSNIATTQRYIVTKGEESKEAANIIGSVF